METALYAVLFYCEFYCEGICLKRNLCLKRNRRKEGFFRLDGKKSGLRLDFRQKKEESDENT